MITFDSIPNFNPLLNFPKKIHQTYSNSVDLPKELQQNIYNIQLINPDWHYQLYSDSDIKSIIFKYYGPSMLNIYLMINDSYGAAKADFFRYLLLYAEGGVYIDIKSTTTKPLTSCIKNDDQFLLSHWNNEKEITIHKEFVSFPNLLNCGEYIQWCIISQRGHKYLKYVIWGVIQNIYNYNILKDNIGRSGVVRLTGPIIYSVEIEKRLSMYNHRKCSVSNDLGIVYSLYEYSKLSHEKIFTRKHYSQLISPIVKPNKFIDYLRMIIYYGY